MSSLPTCCRPWQRQCQKLRIVIVTTKPWGPPIVGTGPTPSMSAFPNAPPTAGLVAAGLPGPVRLSGSPVAIPGLATALPADLLVTYSPYSLAVLAFDFSSPEFCTGQATGTVIARGLKNCTQASLGFHYNWCGQADLPCPSDRRWSIAGCTHNGMQFTVIDDTTYISDNPCLDSIVILGLQQYCCDGAASCEPSGCVPAVLPCLAQRVTSDCVLPASAR